MNPIRLIQVPLLTAMLMAPVAAQSQEVVADAAAVESVVRGFHVALETGNSQTVAGALAPDAVVLEGGDLETRQEYLDHHLQADISFSQAVPTRYGKIDVTVNGDTAWVNATTTTQGTYQEKPLNLVGAESMVLSRTPSGWLIRTIHWSARRAN